MILNIWIFNFVTFLGVWMQLQCYRNLIDSSIIYDLYIYIPELEVISRECGFRKKRSNLTKSFLRLFDINCAVMHLKSLQLFYYVKNKVLRARNIYLKVTTLMLLTKLSQTMLDASCWLKCMYLAMYIVIRFVRWKILPATCAKRALSKNTQSYYRCMRLKVWNWSFFEICKVSVVESSSITVKFFSKL